MSLAASAARHVNATLGYGHST